MENWANLDFMQVVCMATEKQFEFFKSLYEEEAERGKELHEHAKVNLGLTTLYSAFVIFVLEQKQFNTASSKAFFIATVLSLLLAFLLTLWSTQIAVYEAVTDLYRVIKAEYKNGSPSDHDFFDNRIVDYTVARGRNIVVNDRKAYGLLVARYFLLLGIALHACFFFLRID
jgi:hypothetical protein